MQYCILLLTCHAILHTISVLSPKHKGQRVKDGEVLNSLAFYVRGASLVLLIRGWTGTGWDETWFALRTRWNRLRGMSSGMSQGQGLKPAVILAPVPEESKDQNDMQQVQH